MCICIVFSGTNMHMGSFRCAFVHIVIVARELICAQCPYPDDTQVPEARTGLEGSKKIAREEFERCHVIYAILLVTPICARMVAFYIFY